MVLLHTVWEQQFNDKQDFVAFLHKLIDRDDCPSFIKIPYLRVKAPVLQKRSFVEPTNTSDDVMSPFLSQNVLDDLQEIIKLAHMRPPKVTVDSAQNEFCFDNGKTYDWSTSNYHVSKNQPLLFALCDSLTTILLPMLL